MTGLPLNRRFHLWVLAAVFAAGWLIVAACAQGQVATPAAPVTVAGQGTGRGGPASKESWEQTLAAARAEGKLVIYTGMSPDAAVPITAKFRERFGVEAEYITGRGNEVAQRLLREYDAGWVTFIMHNLYGEAEGEKYLRQFATQDLAVLKDIRLQVEWVARGKYAVGVGVPRDEVSNFNKVGAPIRLARLSEGGQVNPGGGMIAMLAKPAHPNAAALMLNWLLTADGQEVFSQGFKAPPVRLGVPTSGIDPDAIAQPGEKIYWTDEEFFRLQGEYLSLGKDIFGPLMK